jgi:tetratricopeptide (TPR) repeat protein
MQCQLDGEGRSNAMMDQGDLFDLTYQERNCGIADLKELRFADAGEKLRKYGEATGDFTTVAVYREIAGFLQDGLGEIDRNTPDAPRRCWELWRRLQTRAAHMQIPDSSFLNDLERSYFREAAGIVERLGLAASPRLPGCDLPTGLIYFAAGNWDRAIASLQACLPTALDNATVYSYLGNAYLRRGEPEVARRCYLEACLVNPGEMDWKRLEDKDLLSLRAVLEEEASGEYSSAAPAVAWLPTHAYIAGIFKPKIIRLKDEFKIFVEEFQQLEKRYIKEKEPSLGAALFFRAIIICDNEVALRLVKGMDFAEIRARMRETEPRLFADYLRVIKNRGK